MLKKILISILCIFSFSEAITLEKEYHSVSPEQYGIFDTWIKFSGNEYDASVENKDWIALYKKGASTEWKNVIDWNWVKDLDCIAPAPCHDLFLAKGLPEGEYEVRYFKNNSYTIDTSIDMSVKPHRSYLKNIVYYHNRDILTVYCNGFTSKVEPNPTDWVGIYRVDSDNSRDNIVKWSWVENLHKYSRSRRWIIDKNELDNGRYEIRYFLNNSFETYKKSKPFDIGVNTKPTLAIGDIVQVGLNDAKLSVYFKNRNQRSKKDWMALFESGTDYIHENIVAWQYLDPDSVEGTVTFTVHPRRWNGKSLDAVLFKNDSYTTMAVATKAF
jgi:hypothetical protein